MNSKDTQPQYPQVVRCYLLEARDGLPPHPQDDPVASRVVESREDQDRVEAELKREHPNSWMIALPLE